MRKSLLYALLLILAITMVLPVGCSCKRTDANGNVTESLTNCLDNIKDQFCSNRDVIEARISESKSIIDAVDKTYIGQVIPLEAKDVINAAQDMIAKAEQMLAASWCPTDAEVSTLSKPASELAVMKVKLNAVRKMKGLKAIGK